MKYLSRPVLLPKKPQKVITQHSYVREHAAVMTRRNMVTDQLGCRYRPRR